MFKKAKALVLAGVLTMVMSTTALGALLPTDRSYRGSHMGTYEDSVVTQPDGSTIEYYQDYTGKISLDLPRVVRTVLSGENGNTIRYDLNATGPDGKSLNTGAYLTVSNVLRESVTDGSRLLYAKAPVSLAFAGQYFNDRTIREFNNCTVENGRVLYNKSLDYRTLAGFTKEIMNNIQTGGGSDADQTETLTKPGMYSVSNAALWILPSGKVFVSPGVRTYVYVAGDGEDISYVAPTTETATAMSATINVNGKPLTGYGYSINGANYFKLRDMAAMLNGTGLQFDIAEAPGMNMVTIKTYGSPAYSAVGEELTTATSGTQPATPTTKNYAIDGSEVRPSAYSIGGADYINLVDLAKIVDFATNTDGSTININTTTGYLGNGAVTATVPIKVASTERLAGQNRFQTAVAISQNGWPHSENVVIASGNDFHDALVGSSFAYLKDAPMLITPSNALDTDIRGEIARLGAKTVYILGSTKSVSQSVEDDLKLTYNVIRIGGADVFETAVQVGNEVQKIKSFDTVVLATYLNFPDVLAMAPYSAKNTIPILFSGVKGLGVDTQDAIKAWGVKNIIIAGGTSVIASVVENQLTNMGITVTRLAGYDRYDTSLEIIKYFGAKQPFNSIAISTGENFPDCLSGAVLAAKNNMPIVLVEKASAKSTITDYLNSSTLDKAYIFGGTAVVSTKITGN